MTPMPAESPENAEITAWAASGAMTLTGRPDSPPLGPPVGLVSRLRSIAAGLHDRSRALGSLINIDPLALLGERAAHAGLRRHGATSCSGSTRLLPAVDGWIAVSLARAEDVELVPAWLELRTEPDDTWRAVTEIVTASPTRWLVERARLLGLPVGVLPSGPRATAREPGRQVGLPLRASAIAGPSTSRAPLTDARVIDLSSLWAGPLCASLLAVGGADVVKVESVDRADGARLGPPGFFDLLNVNKRSVALDLRGAEGRAALASLIADADVVIEASRPRALEQMGIDARHMIATGGPSVWVSITGHGRNDDPDRVAFGDDAAVEGGLVSWDSDGPCFCSDAIADPITSLAAAAGVVEALASGGRWLLDVSMSGLASSLAGPTLPAPLAILAAPPRARTAAGRAPRLGEHTHEVLAAVPL